MSELTPEDQRKANRAARRMNREAKRVARCIIKDTRLAGGLYVLPDRLAASVLQLQERCERSRNRTEIILNMGRINAINMLIMALDQLLCDHQAIMN